MLCAFFGVAFSNPSLYLNHKKFSFFYGSRSSEPIGPISRSPPALQGASWELDFSSRPILDLRGKKLWELLITDEERSFVFSEFFLNNQINTVNLGKSLEKFLKTNGAKRPTSCRFFRGKMYTIISQALSNLEISPLPSRRCFSLLSLLNARLELVYKQHPRYSNVNTNTLNLNISPPAELPDAFRGEKWAFVQLPLSELQKDAEEVINGNIFGSYIDMEFFSNKNKADTLVPGVAVFSRRAVPLAAWTNGLELATITVDTERACLILETGIDTRWRYGSYQSNKATDQEAQAWEKAKMFADGIHFLAIQSNPESEEVAGLWLLIARELPKI